MSDINIRVTGHAGRITLTRPKALNALSYDMCLAVDAALKAWENDDKVKLVVLDAEGEKAFCAGGDIQEMYDTGTKGDFEYGRRFWRDEYRMNARIFEYPKPIVSFLQGFTMGGGVGLGCHGSHRVVGNSSRIAMPEVGIGLVPDVGGSLMLALAPGRLGEFLGTTGARMKAADAIFAGFADQFIVEGDWPALIAALEETGDPTLVETASKRAPDGRLAAQLAEISTHFGAGDLTAICDSLTADGGEFAQGALSDLQKKSPLSVTCTIEMIQRLRGDRLTIRSALEMEYRFTHRAMEHGDFLEGIRALIIDKDLSPKWRYADQTVPASAVSQLLQPLAAEGLRFEEDV